MKYRFPNIDLVQKQLLSCVYQEEEFQYLYQSGFKKVKSFLKKTTDNKFILREIKNYNSEGYLITQEILNHENDKKELRIFNYEPNYITAEYIDQIITWEFNSEGILIREIHNFKFDRPTTYNFELDDNGDLIRINEVRFNKLDGITNLITSDSSSKSLYDNIQFNEKEKTIQFGKEAHQNKLKLDNEGRVVKRINNYRLVETVYDDFENWKSYLSIGGRKKHLNFSKKTVIRNDEKITIETKYTESGEIEYELKEVYIKNE